MDTIRTTAGGILLLILLALAGTLEAHFERQDMRQVQQVEVCETLSSEDGYIFCDG